MSEQIYQKVADARLAGASEEDLTSILDNRPDLIEEFGINQVYTPGQHIPYGQEFDTPVRDTMPVSDGFVQDEPIEVKGKPHEIPRMGDMFVPEMAEPEEPYTFEWSDTLVAGFMKYNPITALSVQAQDYMGSIMDGEQDDPNYTPYENFDSLAGYPYELFRNSNSQMETDRIKRQYDRDYTIDKQINETGYQGVVSAVAGGIANPIYLIPYLGVGAQAGIVYRSSALRKILPIKTRDAIYKSMYKTKVAQGGVRQAVEGFTGEAITEALYHGLDVDMQRTVGESVFNMAAGAIAGGVLGAVFTKKAMNPEQYDKLMTDLSKDVKIVGKISEGAPIVSLSTEEGVEQLTKHKKLLSKLTPLRVLASDNPLSRKLGALIGEQNVVNTTRAAVETLIKKYDGSLATGLGGLRDSHKIYKSRGGNLAYNEFSEEVTRALRNGDVHPTIPEAEAASKLLRSEILEPMEKLAKEAGFLKEGQSAKFAKSYFPRQYNFSKIDAKRSEFIDDLTNWLSGEYPSFEQADLRDAARELARKLTDGPQTKLHYGDDVKFTAGALKGKTVPVPDNTLAPWLINEPDSVLRSFTHDMATHVEMNKMFGSTDLAKEFDEISKEWDKMIERAGAEGNEKLAHKYSRKKDEDLQILAALRDRLLNRYKLPDNPRSFFIRAGRAARNLNILRLLGGMTMSAFPDLARPLYHHSFSTYAKAIHALSSSSEFRKMAAADLRRMGVGTEMVLHGRLRAIAEADFMPARTSKAETILESLVTGKAGGKFDFGKMSLMSPWNTAVKDLTGLMSQDGLIAHLTKNVKYTKKLKRHGIPPEMVNRMKEQLSKHGDTKEGLRFANSDKWDDMGAAELFESTILREVDATIITPGIMDKPLWMSSEMGKLVGQLKSFGFAATNKQLLSGLNNFDGRFIQGNLMAITLGAMTYMAKRKLAGQDPDLEPHELLMKGIDYSGVIGMGAEAIQFGTGMANAAGLYKGDGNWRWARQGMLGTVGGPGLGLAEDMFRAPRALTSEQPNAGDVEALRRMMPYNNLFYIAPLFKMAEQRTKDRLHIVE